MALVAGLLSCGGGNGVRSAESARRAYLGLDRAVDRALGLGMDGFNAASSANIPPQTAMGDVSGTLTVTGQVDQGASPNKQMRLRTEVATYSDGVTDGDGGATNVRITYATSAASLPALDLSLRGIPNGTFTGTWAGAVTMTGDLVGDVTLALSFSGRFEPVAAGSMNIRRVPGSTTITGTATSSYGEYPVNLTR